MAYIAAGIASSSGSTTETNEVNRRKHISVARELSRLLHSEAREFDRVEIGTMEPSTLWESMQPSADVKARLATFLDDLYFDGIRSRFFGDFDSEKLILPVAADIARRLEALADDLERQLDLRGQGGRSGDADDTESRRIRDN